MQSLLLEHKSWLSSGIGNFGAYPNRSKYLISSPEYFTQLSQHLSAIGVAISTCRLMRRLMRASWSMFTSSRISANWSFGLDSVQAVWCMFTSFETRAYWSTEPDLVQVIQHLAPIGIIFGYELQCSIEDHYCVSYIN